MKLNKLMFAALAVGAMALASCNKQPVNPPIIPPTPSTDEAPEVEKPADGNVTIVINIPAGSECNGIAVKGTTDGQNWVGENQYLAADGSIADAAGCAKFQKVEGNWYKVTIKLGAGYAAKNAKDEDVTNYLAGKICLIYKNDNAWQGQAINWDILDDTNIACSLSGDGNLQINGTQGVCYLKIGGWQSSECAVLSDYKITVLTPKFCDGEFDIELVGSFEGWGSAPVALKKEADLKYTATIKAAPNAELKVRGVGGWDKEVQGYVDDTKSEAYDTWIGVPNVVLGEETNVTIDYSDPAKYRWNVCE